MFYRLLAKLLDYPNSELMTVLPGLRTDMRAGFEAGEWIVLDRFMKDLSLRDLTDAQAEYVQTFDLNARHALHLTHHLFGDDKNRGPALIDLTEFYKEFGLELVTQVANDETGEITNELPDFLPVLLEFAAQLEPEEARMFLSQWSRVLNVLASNLEEAGSPYAPLIRLVEQRSQLVRAAA